MLSKSYKTLLNFYTGFKTNIKLVIYDIDTRLKEIESGTKLENTYASKEHTHSDYALVEHTHSNYAPVTHTLFVSPFTLADTQGSIIVNTQFPITENEFYILNDNEHFTYVTSTDNSIILDYEFESVPTDTFVLVYFHATNENFEPIQTLSVTVPDTEEDNLRITATVTDENNEEVTEGNVTFNLQKRDNT